MTEVISFRLDIANPREAQALEVLNAWIEKGFSTRFILTKALLELDHPGSDVETSQDDPNLSEVLEPIGQVLDIVKSMKTNPINSKYLGPEPSNLHESFIVSVKKGFKPGLKSG